MLRPSALVSCTLLALVATVGVAADGRHERARDLGIPFDGTPGPLNAITDVQGVLVGQTTLIPRPE